MLQVSKLDTLAGIAIKYNVEVGALKVANGLYSDMSLFARDHVKIPKKKLQDGFKVIKVLGDHLNY